MIDTITVLKLNPHRQVTWQYQGEVLERDQQRLVLQAYFDRPDADLHGIKLRMGDRFIETYYTDRWYNIFEIHAVEDDSLRGWYCNITLPAEIDGDKLSYVDLALDLLVFPDMRQLILDEDEFAALDLSPTVRRQALAALMELRGVFEYQQGKYGYSPHPATGWTNTALDRSSL